MSAGCINSSLPTFPAFSSIRICVVHTCSIEDTDLARSTKESEQNLMEELKWLGIEWDEGEPSALTANRIGNTMDMLQALSLCHIVSDDANMP